MTYWYLATPYSKFAGGLDAAYDAACEQAGVFVRARVPVFSPIAHTHGIAKRNNIDALSHTIWLAVDHPLMEAAHGLVVCRLPGWQDSYGIAKEISAFRKMGKPVVFMEPDVLPEGVFQGWPAAAPVVA